jgi:hypothetical protein
VLRGCEKQFQHWKMSSEFVEIADKQGMTCASVRTA